MRGNADTGKGNRFFVAIWWGTLVGVWAVFGLPYVLAAIRFETWAFETVLFRYPDRVLNFALARNFMEYGFNFLDPVNRTDLIFYNFPLYWFWGGLAKLTGLEPWGVANFLQVGMPVLFFIGFYLLARQILHSRWWALGTTLIPFFFQPVYFTYLPFGEHAVLLPFHAILFNSFGDTYGIVLGCWTLLFLLRWVDGLESRGGLLNRDAVLFCTCYLAASLCQLLSFLFLTGCVFLSLFFHTFRPSAHPRMMKALYTLGLATSVLVVIPTGPHLLPVPFLALAALGIFGASVAYSRVKIAWVIPLIPVLGTFLYIGVNLGVVFFAGQGGFAYQEAVRESDLDIPLWVAGIAFLPLLVTLPWALSDWRAPHAWFFHGMAWASLVLCFNHAFGYNNHPYRFFHHFYPFLLIPAAYGVRRFLERLRANSPSRARFYPAVVYLALVGALIVYGVVDSVPLLKRQAREHLVPVPEEIRLLAAFCEAQRALNPDVRIGVRDRRLDALMLAPYTGVRFQFETSLTFNSRWEQPWRPRAWGFIGDILERIRKEKIPIDILIVGKDSLYEPPGIRDTSEGWESLGRFRVYYFEPGS